MSAKNGIYGWAGTVLRVNLTTGAITFEDTLPKYKVYVGGMGIGYKVLWDEVPMDTPAYSEAAKVVIAVGPLTGSGVPCSGRTNITLLSSFSRAYSIIDSHMGGHFAHNMKYAGYDAIIIEGKGDKPVYLKIDDDKVTLEDASHVWGTGTFNSNKVIAKECGPEFDVATIGQAGENLVNMSCLVTSVGNVAGAGTGSALGYKMLKGIAVRGTGAVMIADPVKHKELCDYMLRDLVGANNNHNVPNTPQSWAEYSAVSGNRWRGAPGVTWGAAKNGPIDTGEQPVGDINKIAYRTTKGAFDQGEVITKYIAKQGGCASCPVRCYPQYDCDILAEYDMPTKVSNTCGPTGTIPKNFFAEGHKDFRDEGDGPGIISLHGSYVQDDLGLWCNYGNIAREFKYCYLNGILEKVLPKEEYDSIPWQLMKDCDPRWLDDIYRRIAYKEGEISRLGEGTVAVLKAWGLDDPSKNHLGINFYDDVISLNQNVTHGGFLKHHSADQGWQTGLLYNIMYNRDCMVHTLTNATRCGASFDAVVKPVFEGFFGEGCVDAPKAYTPINENKVKLAKWSILEKQWHDSATLCNWMYPMIVSPSKARGYAGDIELDAKFMTAVTGEEWTMDEILFDMERITQMLRAMTAISFKIHEDVDNLRTTHDKVSEWHFTMDPDLKPFEKGTTKMDREDWEKSLDMFYDAMGWDKATGIPTRATLEKFGLADMADKLESMKLI